MPNARLPEEGAWIAGNTRVTFISEYSPYERLDLSRFDSRQSRPCENRAGRCRCSVGFLGDLPFPQSLHYGAAPFSPRFALIGSQDLDVKSRPNLSTCSLLMRFWVLGEIQQSSATLCVRTGHQHDVSSALGSAEVDMSGGATGTGGSTRRDTFALFSYSDERLYAASVSLVWGQGLVSGLYSAGSIHVRKHKKKKRSTETEGMNRHRREARGGATFRIRVPTPSAALQIYPLPQPSASVYTAARTTTLRDVTRHEVYYSEPFFHPNPPFRWKPLFALGPSGFLCPVVPSWFETRSEIGYKIDTENCCTIRVRAGLEIEIKFMSKRRNWRFGISIRDQQPSSTNIDESEIQNHDISLVQHFYIGTKIKLYPGSELGSFDIGSGKMLEQPGIIGQSRSSRFPMPWVMCGARTTFATNESEMKVMALTPTLRGEFSLSAQHAFLRQRRKSTSCFLQPNRVARGGIDTGRISLTVPYAMGHVRCKNHICDE
ncbi:hypothetical protein PR048_016869 [Dryococelus australis]|uniref:Uncharacterized protein n=1 Tax=Dryococelus australis TaxID=614101 RepID=A0ABQ9H7Y3_9NEOP|nr:hypothetical protein PR048_016869 [Dryococelus australis]